MLRFEQLRPLRRIAVPTGAAQGFLDMDVQIERQAFVKPVSERNFVRREIEMRYFFDIFDHAGHSIDQDGIEYADHTLALRDARLTAISILRDGEVMSSANVVVHVRNEQGLVGEITAALRCNSAANITAS